jgi:DNA repair and recombination protein RAD52
MTIFTDEQKNLLDQKLDSRLISEREGGGNTTLKYVEGHDAIDQANRIFGYGNWSYRPLFCEQKVLTDPISGEAVGIAYKAQVELTVRDCNPIVEVGSQPVAAWNVRDTVLSRRKKGDTSDIQQWEATRAARTIVESHEMAEKGAVTDALKRALRTFGNQFGNGLYGDGHVDLSRQDAQPATNGHQPVAVQPASTKPTSDPAQMHQIQALRARCKAIGKDFSVLVKMIRKAAVPDDALTAEDCAKADTLIARWEGFYAKEQEAKATSGK